MTHYRMPYYCLISFTIRSYIFFVNFWNCNYTISIFFKKTFFSSNNSKNFCFPFFCIRVWTICFYLVRKALEQKKKFRCGIFCIFLFASSGYVDRQLFSWGGAGGEGALRLIEAHGDPYNGHFRWESWVRDAREP